MKLIIGLGNPGEKYQNTRHNVGYMMLDKLLDSLFSHYLPPLSRHSEFSSESKPKFKLSKKLNSEILKLGTKHYQLDADLILTKPQTYMNKSGLAVQKLIAYYSLPLDHLYVIHDDLDIKLGKYKIQKAKGPKIHNGLQSIYHHLGTKNFWHVRIGIENRNSHTKKIPGEKYVLSQFSKKEKETINQAINQITKQLIHQTN